MKFSDLKMPKSKKTPPLLLERPPPPTVDQLVEDVKSAPADDIAFRREKNDANGMSLGMSHVDISGFAMASSGDDEPDEVLATPLEDDDDDDDHNLAAARRTYDRVVELVDLTDRLDRAPRELRTLQRAMNEAAEKLDESVKSLTAKASESS